MEANGRTILVTGATGHQGGAVARHLLDDGWHVRALTRHAETPAARALAESGAEVVVGDMLDRASLDAAVRGAHGVYSVQNLSAGAEAEVQEARNLADAALAAGVRHFVYSSVRGAEIESGMPWMVSKHDVEMYLRSLDLPLTIWRPVTFMENFLREKADLLAGHLKRSMPASTPWQYIAVDDIGRFVALSFCEPERWIGQATAIGGDGMTLGEVAEVFARVLGRPVAFEQIEAPEGMPAPVPAPPGSPGPTLADIAFLRAVLPDLQTLEGWARSQLASAANTKIQVAAVIPMPTRKIPAPLLRFFRAS